MKRTALNSLALVLLMTGLNGPIFGGKAIAQESLYGPHSFVETHRIEDVLSHLGDNLKIDADTLLIFDLDNTLIETHQLLGSDQWFEHHFRQQQAIYGKENHTALQKTLQDYDAIHLRSDVRLIDPTVPKLFERLKKMGVKMLGLTSRSTALQEATLRQLTSVGLSFKTPWIAEKMHYVLKNAKHGSVSNGIVLTGGEHKGNCLVEYLDYLQFKPSRVVFVDDKPHHLDHVKQVLEDRQIPFIGLRYGFRDEKVSAFDPKIAEIQFEYLTKILSDEDAQAIVEARAKNKL